MGMKVTRTTTVTKTIDRCFHQCPYFTLEGDAMMCEHPDAPEKGFIVSHLDCDTGFPPKCPLVKCPTSAIPPKPEPPPARLLRESEDGTEATSKRFRIVTDGKYYRVQKRRRLLWLEWWWDVDCVSPLPFNFMFQTSSRQEAEDFMRELEDKEHAMDPCNWRALT